MAEAKKETAKVSFQESLTKVLEGMEGKDINPSEKIKVKFTDDFHSFKKNDISDQGILTGLTYIEMGIAKKA